jgi:hypothetical protein
MQERTAGQVRTAAHERNTREDAPTDHPRSEQPICGLCDPGYDKGQEVIRP